MNAFTKKRGAVGWPNPQAKAIERAARLLDIDLESDLAQTGTIYLAGLLGDDEVKVRVADHGECYCTEDISCDPTGFTVRNAIEWLAAKAGKPVPASIMRGWKAAETRKANFAKKQADRRAARLARLREILGGADAVDWDTPDGAPITWLPAGSANRKARIRNAAVAVSSAWDQVNREGRNAAPSE